MAESSKEALEAEGAEQVHDGNTGFQNEWDRLRQEDRGLLPKEGSRDDLPDEDAGATAEEDPDGLDGSEPADPPDEGAADSGPAAEETADIWANADPKLRDAFEAEKAARARAENQNRTQNSRLSQAQRRLNELETQVEGYRSKGVEAPKGEDGKSREERMAALREEYPDLAAPLLDEIDNLRQTVTALSGQAASESRLRTEAFLDEQERLLEERHAGWLKETETPEWRAWVAEQPQHILDALTRNGDRIVDAVEAADLFDRFKAATCKAPPPEDERRDELQERRKRQLEAGRTGSVRTPSAPAREGDTFQAEWDRLREQERRERAGGMGR